MALHVLHTRRLKEIRMASKLFAKRVQAEHKWQKHVNRPDFKKGAISAVQSIAKAAMPKGYSGTLTFHPIMDQIGRLSGEDLRKGQDLGINMHMLASVTKIVRATDIFDKDEKDKRKPFVITVDNTSK